MDGNNEMLNSSLAKARSFLLVLCHKPWAQSSSHHPLGDALLTSKQPVPAASSTGSTHHYGCCRNNGTWCSREAKTKAEENNGSPGTTSVTTLKVPALSHLKSRGEHHPWILCNFFREPLGLFGAREEKWGWCPDCRAQDSDSDLGLVFCCFQPQASQGTQGSEQTAMLTGTGDRLVALLFILLIVLEGFWVFFSVWFVFW